MAAFEYVISDDKSDFFEVSFSGELRSGKDLESDDFESLLKNIKKESHGKVIIIKLENMRFWDTEGMGKILRLIKEINSNKAFRAAVIAPKETKNFERAKEKHPVDTDIIPWEETIDAFVDKIS